MRGFASHTICGMLSRDAEVKMTLDNGTDIIDMSVPVKNGFGDKEETIWYNITWFKKDSDKVIQLLQKGSIISCNVRQSIHKVVDTNGNEKTYQNWVVVGMVDIHTAPSQKDETGWKNDQPDDSIPF